MAPVQQTGGTDERKEQPLQQGAAGTVYGTDPFPQRVPRHLILTTPQEENARVIPILQVRRRAPGKLGILTFALSWQVGQLQMNQDVLLTSLYLCLPGSMRPCVCCKSVLQTLDLGSYMGLRTQVATGWREEAAGGGQAVLRLLWTGPDSWAGAWDAAFTAGSLGSANVLGQRTLAGQFKAEINSIGTRTSSKGMERMRGGEQVAVGSQDLWTGGMEG